MKEMISKTFDPKLFHLKFFIKDRNDNLTVFEPKLHIRVRPKTDVIPFGQTAS